MSRYRILVADRATAVFYDATSLDRAPIEIGRISEPNARLHLLTQAARRRGKKQ